MRTAPARFNPVAVEQQILKIRELAKSVGVGTDVLDRLARTVAVPVVVIVGETKKGKSSLVNALVARAGVSPVAVDVATATYMTLSYGNLEHAVVTTAKGTEEKISLDQLPSWVTVDGIDSNPDAAGHPVRVTLEAELLRHLTLIDTPGVGGLDGEHTAITLRAVANAGVLLFVTDLATPLTEPEASFLRKVAELPAVVDVIIVANMADKLTGSDAQEALDNLRRRLQDRLPVAAEAPVVKVSAKRAERAQIEDLPAEVRELLRRESGLEELSQVLADRVINRRELLADAQRLRVVWATADQVVRALDPRVQALSGDDPAIRLEQIAELQRELTYLADQARITFHGNMASLRLTLSARIDQVWRDINVRLHGHLDAQRLPDNIEQMLNDAVLGAFNDLSELTRGHLEQAVRRSFAPILERPDAEFADGLRQAMAGTFVESGAQFEKSVLRNEAPALTSDAYIQAAMAMGGGLGFANVLSLLSISLGPVALALPVLAAAFSLRVQTKQRRSMTARRWLDDQMGRSRVQLTQWVTGQLDSASQYSSLALQRFQRDCSERFRIETHALRSSARDGELAQARGQLQQASQIRSHVEQSLRQAGLAAPMVM